MMCMACSLFAHVKAKRISEKHKAVIRVDQLTLAERFYFYGLLSNAGYRFERDTVCGKPAVLTWVLDWS